MRPAPLIRVDPDGSVSIAAQGLYLPNGVVILDAELVVAESLGNRLSAFPIAARLVVSVRTVDHHASAVLQKLGVSGRKAAAAATADLVE